jgi:hypothetical protein
MLVSRSQAPEMSAVIHAAYLVVDRGLLISTEDIEVDCRRRIRHRSELRSADELASAPHGNQFTDLVTVPGDSERLTILDGVHDVLGPVAQIPLGDVGLSAHI